MKYIDMHCDTLSVLYQWPECGHLDKNKICIDIEKLTKGQALCQYLACFVALTEHGNPENVKEIEAEGYVLLDFVNQYGVFALEMTEES